MKKLLSLLLILGLSAPVFSQVRETLKEVEVVGLHFKYLNAMDDQKDSPQVVKELHKFVGNYDILESDIYDVDLDGYKYTFKIPEGKILAGYNSEGDLLWTVEKFKNSKLPYDVAKVITLDYPGWHFDKTFYTINYKHDRGAVQKYKVILTKDGKKKRVVINPDKDIL